MSRLVAFYRGEGTDTEGRSVEQILAWNDDDLEAVHDFIQWLFPLSEPSQYNPDAPLLTDKDIAAFENNPVLQANLMKSFERILTFLGLSLSARGEGVQAENFKSRVADVWAMPNHNWLRITRILRSLTLLGMKAQADRLRVSVSACPWSEFDIWASESIGISLRNVHRSTTESVDQVPDSTRTGNSEQAQLAVARLGPKEFKHRVGISAV